MNYSLGIDIGTSSIKCAIIDEELEVVYTKYSLHKGEVKKNLRELWKQLQQEAKYTIEYSMISGSGAGVLENIPDTLYANEIASIVEGSLLLCPKAASIIEMGGQSAKYITNLREGKHALRFAMNNNCAAGTGSFFEDQMYRIGAPLEKYSEYVEKATMIPRIAGRCSVFAKTDIIHLQQEGVSIENVLLGLAYSMVKNYKNTIVKELPIELPMVVSGGTSYNTGVIRAIKEVFHLKEEEIYIPSEAACIQAIGTAVLALKEKKKLDFSEIFEEKKKVYLNENTLGELAPLDEGEDVTGLHQCTTLRNKECFLGVDVGSTSTNLVLVDSIGTVVDYQYLRTSGNPKVAVQEGLTSIEKRFGNTITIAGVGTTGSGRYLVGKLIGADIVRDEITSQAKGASFAFPKVDTIFEIGGQDSKYIKCQDGVVVDFQMNKICAAGTGSFIEEQAGRLGMPIELFGKEAILSKHPVDLGERCTVFIETNIATCLAKGVEIRDIASGLCYSVVRNYLHKVVGNKPVGEHICLQGGVAHNPGIVAAFRHFYGDKIKVTPFFSVTGAYGVALLAMDTGNTSSQFLGYTIQEEIQQVKIETFNEAALMNKTIYEKTEILYLGKYDGYCDPSKKTVGIPRVLMMHKLFPMAYTFFKELGYNVLLSDSTNEQTIRMSQEYVREETCYPVKLIHGHMAELIEKKVDYIFLPSIHTMKHEHSNVKHNYGCVYMQISPKMVGRRLELEEKGIALLNPIFSLDMGRPHMAKTMISMGKSLGKNTAQCTAALAKAGMALIKYSNGVEEIGNQVIHGLKEDEKVFVLITRNYGLSDPILSMGIAEILLGRGYKVITLSHLPAHDIDISEEYPNLYWPFGQHILSGAKLVKQHPNLYAIYLTNHGCGPDTMLSHLLQEIMAEKPYLSVEVDEHFSKVGLITRIEAFVNSLSKHQQPASVLDIKKYIDKLPHKNVFIDSDIKKINREQKVYLPYIYPYSQLFSKVLQVKGYDAEVLPATTEESINIGRKMTLSKEYISFTALLGDVFKLEEKEKNEHQLLLFQTEGAETDGMYSRLIRSKLDQTGHDEVNIIAPYLERLWEQEEIAEEVWLILLGGDVIMSAPYEKREFYLTTFVNKIITGALSLEEVLNMAKKIGEEKIPEHKLMVVGEPMCMYNGLLNNNMLLWLEKQDYYLYYAPFSEYLYSLWKDTNDKPELKRRLEVCERQKDEISAALGEFSAFSNNSNQLKTIADKEMKNFSGGNGRYRYAKMLQCNANASGVITVASMYENITTILNQMETKKQTLQMSFDGNSNQEDYTKLKAFLYYLNWV